MVELIARDLGLDPAEMRRRNLVRPEELPYTSATGNVYDSGSYHAALARLLEVAAYDRLRREQAAARGDGRHLGIGLACFVELTGPGAQFYGVGGAPISGQEGTTVRLEPGGAVTALVGVTNQGQRTHTALAQIIADELDVPLDHVAVISGDTAVCRTAAARGRVAAPIGGSATLLAARALGERIRTIAATLLEAHAADIELAHGCAVVRGSPGRGLSFGRPGAHSALPVEQAPRRRAEPRGDRALHESGGVDLHQRRAPGRRRGRRRDGQGAACCATSPSMTAGGSSIPRSWRARSPAGSLRDSVERSASTASTTTPDNSSRPP